LVIRVTASSQKAGRLIVPDKEDVMRTSFALVSIVALLAACSNSDADKTAAGGVTAPAGQTVTLATPQPGLWEQTVSGGPMPQAMTVKVCVGDTAPGSNPFSAPQAGVSCSDNRVKAIGGGAEFHTVCQTQGMNIVSDGKVSGNMRTAYTVAVTTKTTGPNVPPQMAEMSMAIDARRLGDCPAGVAPGAVVQ
jgi:hypothetical protein